jgi:inhibitor of cysteine peptidase
MIKSKYVILMISVLLIGVAFVFHFSIYGTKPTVVGAWASESNRKEVLANKIWEIEFSKEMDEETITSDTVFVVDDQGNKIDLPITIREDKMAISIHPPENGYDTTSSFYTLQVKADIKSVGGRSLRSGKDITFSVSEELPVVGNEKKLQAIFHEAINRERQRMKQEVDRGIAVEESATAQDKASGNEATAAAGNDFSETNVQVQGVDEADIVKTDGTYIYQAFDRKLTITKAVPASAIEAVSTISYQNFEPFQLFVDGNKLVVIGHSYHEYDHEAESKMVLPIYQQSKAVVYDLTDRSNPKEVKTVEIEGSYLTARKIGSTIYLINNHYPDYWIMEKEKGIDLRPRYSDSAVSDESQYIDYEEIRYFPESKDANYSIIATFNIEEPEKEVTISTYLGSGNDIYMSKESLYISVAKYTDVPISSNRAFDSVPALPPMNTEIFKFTVNELDVSFVASGNVSGRLLNQFSMDEYDGHFRIATTKGETWNEQTPSSNNVYILDQNMSVVGSVEDLARGERIYSVRFMGEKAYVVTFKEVDPLFVLDVSNPKKPTVLGELKIPGFSNYLHPYDENHLIGFGQNTKLIKGEVGTSPRVVTDGVKISLFDVTDPINPKEKFTEIIGGSGTHSPLNYDHKALLFNKEKNIFAFPISVYKDKPGSEYEQMFEFQGAYAYSISLEEGFQLQQKITHEQQNVICENWENQIRRVLYIEDHFYAVSPKKISAHKVDW